MKKMMMTAAFVWGTACAFGGGRAMEMVDRTLDLADETGIAGFMQAMGPNVSGVIGSAVVAGVLYTLCR